MLQAEQPFLGAFHPLDNMLETKVDSSKARLHRLMYDPRIT
jgi:hypothetical protein